jgi:predicted DCC family thiol-disulfide oxidoreductase YuxK
MTTTDGAEPLWLFYDGGCGLCHRAVRFVLRRDPAGTGFRYAPIGGGTFEELVAPEARAALPDSVLLRGPSGQLWTRSDAVVQILRHIGGLWALLGVLLWLVPRPLRDYGYDRVAACRRRWFAPPKQACPILPPELRARFGG